MIKKTQQIRYRTQLPYFDKKATKKTYRKKSVRNKIGKLALSHIKT